MISFLVSHFVAKTERCVCEDLWRQNLFLTSQAILWAFDKLLIIFVETDLINLSFLLLRQSVARIESDLIKRVKLEIIIYIVRVAVNSLHISLCYL